MSMEPEEVKVRTRIHRLDRAQGHLQASHKDLSRKQQNELDSLTKKVQKDQMLTIQLRESSVDKLRDFSIYLKGEGNGMTYDNVITYLFERAKI